MFEDKHTYHLNTFILLSKFTLFKIGHSSMHHRAELITKTVHMDDGYVVQTPYLQATSKHNKTA